MQPTWKAQRRLYHRDGRAQVRHAHCSGGVHAASPNLNVSEDTYLSGASSATSFNYGGATSLQVANSTTVTNQRTALLRWNDFSSIPTGATISSASIVLQVQASPGTSACVPPV